MRKLLLSLAFLIMLSIVVGCGNTVVLEIPNETFEPTEFIGWWVNVDMNAGGITQIQIEDGEEETLIIHEWGRCEPTDCYWGYQIVSYSDALDGTIEIIWLPGFAEKTQELMLLSDGSLQVTTFVHFIDNSGRPDYETDNYFTLYE